MRTLNTFSRAAVFSNKTAISERAFLISNEFWFTFSKFIEQISSSTRPKLSVCVLKKLFSTKKKFFSIYFELKKLFETWRSFYLQNFDAFEKFSKNNNLKKKQTFSYKFYNIKLNIRKNNNNKLNLELDWNEKSSLNFSLR